MEHVEPSCTVITTDYITKKSAIKEKRNEPIITPIKEKVLEFTTPPTIYRDVRGKRAYSIGLSKIGEIQDDVSIKSLPMPRKKEEKEIVEEVEDENETYEYQKMKYSKKRAEAQKNWLSLYDCIENRKYYCNKKTSNK